jgi:hypothetical protein
MEGDAMGDEKYFAEAAVQLVTNLALSCAALIIGAETGLLGRHDLDQARLKEWIDSFAATDPPARKLFHAVLSYELERLRRET